MNTKTIQTQQGLIVWDSFRGSFTMLMNTSPLLIECKILYEIDGYTPKPKFLFKMHETDGLQQETRRVSRENIFTLEYKVESIDDSVLVDRFDWFFNEYITNKDRLAERNSVNNLIDEYINKKRYDNNNKV